MLHIWLSILKNMDYTVYLKLIKTFGNIQYLYKCSKNKSLFYSILVKNNLFIHYSLFQDMTNENLKIVANKLYSKLKNLRFNIIAINSNEYPKRLMFSYFPPLFILIKDNLDVNKITVYVDGISNIVLNEKKVFNYILKISKNNNFNIISSENPLLTFKFINIFSDEDIDDFLYTKESVIGVYYNTDNIKNNKKDYQKYLELAFCDFFFLLSSEYNLNIVNNIDICLELGKDIVTIPGSVYDKKYELNNWLLKQGAICITCKKDFIEYMNSLKYDN